MDKIQRLEDEKKGLEIELREVNFKLQNDPKNRNKYLLSREIIKLQNRKKSKEIEIEEINNKIIKLKEKER